MTFAVITGYMLFHSIQMVNSLLSCLFWYLCFSKTFDIDMSPLPFNSEKVYHFFMERFENTGTSVQEQNLAWLQVNKNVYIW